MNSVNNTFGRRWLNVRGKFLSDFPEIAKEIDFSKHPEIDISKIKAGSDKTIINWICVICKESYQRNVHSKISRGNCCPKKECLQIRREKTNNELYGWKPKYNTRVKRNIGKRRTVPEPSENDIEEWKDLPKELNVSNYQVSNLGKIKNKKTNYIFLFGKYKREYRNCDLITDNGSRKSFLIHILVAKTFISNPDNKPTVNHINNNKLDNRVINLEWATRSEQNFKENKKNGQNNKNRGKSINQYDLKGNFIKTWKKLIDAQNELGIDVKNISQVLRGKQKTAGGFIWKYNEMVNSMDGEIWKKCFLGFDYEDEIYVSNLGRVKRKNNIPTYGTSLQKYYVIRIYINKETKYKTFLIHRLVALAFIPNPENKRIVNHKDENRGNNNVENLEWMTDKENVNYSLNKKNRIKQNSRSKIVIQINPKTKEIINEFISVSQASLQTNTNPKSIKKCCEFKQQLAGECEWKYK